MAESRSPPASGQQGETTSVPNNSMVTSRADAEEAESMFIMSESRLYYMLDTLLFLYYCVIYMHYILFIHV